jgi:PAS domain S-box-containing protein
MLGLSCEQLLSHDFGQIGGSNFDFMLAWSRYRQRGRAQGEFCLMRPDGSLRELEYSISSEFVPGKHLAVLRDTTERKRAEDALRAARERFRALLEQSSDAIAVVAPDGALLFASGAAPRILGYAPEELLGRKLFELIHAEDVERVRAMLGEALHNPGAVIAAEYRARRRDGQWVWLESVSVNRTREPLVGGIVCNFRDVTERKQIEEHLRRAQKMDALGRLVGSVAHDFNNVLTAVLLYTGLLLTQLTPEGDAHRHADEIRRAAEQGSALVRELLSLARQQALELRVLSLGSVLDEMREMLQRLIGEGIELVLQASPGLGKVRADAAQMQQVVLNLVLNARDAMPEGGTLTLRLNNRQVDAALARKHAGLTPGGYVVLTVADTGCGMAAETRARMFEPFFTTKPKGKGTGLGLPTVYGIVQQTGGKIYVESDQGLGTSISIYLPQIEPVGKPQVETNDQALSPAERPSPPTLMLVEDDDLVRRSLREILERAGFRVLEARDGIQALELGRSHRGPIALLITDLVMPRMSGEQLAEKLTSLRPETQLLYISGYSDEARIGPLQAAGAAFFGKPFRYEDVVQKVRDLLRTGAAAPAQ